MTEIALPGARRRRRRPPWLLLMIAFLVFAQLLIVFACAVLLMKAGPWGLVFLVFVPPSFRNLAELLPMLAREWERWRDGEV